MVFQCDPVPTPLNLRFTNHNQCIDSLSSYKLIQQVSSHVGRRLVQSKELVIIALGQCRSHHQSMLHTFSMILQTHIAHFLQHGIDVYQHVNNHFAGISSAFSLFPPKKMCVFTYQIDSEKITCTEFYKPKTRFHNQGYFVRKGILVVFGIDYILQYLPISNFMLVILLFQWKTI